jgi:hypothetical protein
MPEFRNFLEAQAAGFRLPAGMTNGRLGYSCETY